MAAIDKLYVHSFYEYDELRKWAIAYYPELLFHFYDITVTYKQWENNCKDYAKRQFENAKKEFDKLKQLGDPFDRNIIVFKKIQCYREQGIEMPLENAIETVDYTVKAYQNTEEDWEELYSMPVMNTPLEVDRKLLWICPVPCVRKYLEEQCGYKTKWYHKLFWRGKKHF